MLAKSVNCSNCLRDLHIFICVCLKMCIFGKFTRSFAFMTAFQASVANHVCILFVWVAGAHSRLSDPKRNAHRPRLSMGYYLGLSRLSDWRRTGKSCEYIAHLHPSLNFSVCPCFISPTSKHHLSSLLNSCRKCTHLTVSVTAIWWTLIQLYLLLR